MDHIKNCILFRKLSQEDFEYAMAFFSCREAQYTKGNLLNTLGRPMKNFGLVVAGTVQVYMDDIDGQRMIMANVTPGETFGEALCFLGSDANIYIQAITDTRVMWMDTNRIRLGGRFADVRDTMLANRFTAMLAMRTLSMNERIQILSKPTLREKLITFFSQYSFKNGSSTFTIPFDRASMAEYLGANRSALSRELAKMKNEGIINYQKNKFTISCDFYTKIQ